MRPLSSRAARFAVYAVTGCCAELAYTGITGFGARAGRPRAHTSPWMLPVYGLLQPLFEPLHDRMRPLPAVQRAAVYSAGFLAVEYASGRLLRRWVGEAPWDYSHARFHLHGLIRAEYVPLWAVAGLAVERLHDCLAPWAGG